MQNLLRTYVNTQLALSYVTCSIDTTHASGMERMINDNHKKTNCKVVVKVKDALSIYSIRPIFRGQELCFDYKDSSAHWRKVSILIAC